MTIGRLGRRQEAGEVGPSVRLRGGEGRVGNFQLLVQLVARGAICGAARWN